MKRSLLLTGALLLAAPAMYAVMPGARTEMKMVYDEKTTHMVLFGGETATDNATRLPNFLGDTWEWTGARWLQRFPATSPSARSTHGLVYDSARGRTILFGGRTGSVLATEVEYNDTWAYANGNWTKIDTPNSPPARQYVAMAYDRVRDKIVLFGGSHLTPSGKTFTLTSLFDTWEFDGTTWTQRSSTGPSVSKPTLVYDEARNEVLMTAIGTDGNSAMYRYDPAAGTWNQVKPSKLPPCVNESALVFQQHNNTVLLTGGLCQLSSVAEETYEWDGTDWKQIQLLTGQDRTFGHALGYDKQRQLTVDFGGTVAFATPRSSTYIYRDAIWIPVSDNLITPTARSLFALATDPERHTTWLYGGLGENGNLVDFWEYAGGGWINRTDDNTPKDCFAPTMTFDTDRRKMVLVCSTSVTWEWDGSNWQKFEFDQKNRPPVRTLSKTVYDENLKKTVLFGGFFDPDYYSETWTWDGTRWARVNTRNTPPKRVLQSMWFDPSLKKTVIYGGIGRESTEDRVSRYADMWSFDGTNWTEVKPGTTPGVRYGAQSTVDPRTNHVILFGGLRVDDVPPSTNGGASSQVQVYANDTWDWDGTKWTKLDTPNSPTPRENSALAYDPTRNEIVMFAGWSGYYLADTWVFNGKTWEARSEPLQRRRPTGR